MTPPEVPPPPLAGDPQAVLDAFLTAVPAVAWLKDGAGRYVYVNALHRKTFESTATWVGRTDPEVWPPDVAIDLSRNDVLVRSLGQKLEAMEAGPDRAGNRLVFRVIKFPVPLGGGVGVGGMGFDITRQQDYEEARRKAEWQALQAQKLESLGVLAGGIAHDFNNLLTGVLGFAGLAQAAVPEGGDVAGWLGQIETAAVRAADLCRQMLAYAGRGAFVVAAADLNDLVTGMTQLLSTAVSKSAVLRYNLAADLPPVRCDGTQIRQVVMNLITNAADAVGGTSGLITVTTGLVDAGEGYRHEASADPLPAGRYVFLEVSDTGCGMDDATKARIFEPFYTTKFAGRGLGLSAVLGIIRSHKGALKVYSAPGKGTTFRVLLPAQAGVAAAAPPAAVSPPARFGAGRLALVVDDEYDVRALVRETLELAGFTVELAADGRAGLEAFRARAGAVAVVVLDLTMPELNGVDTFRELRHVHGDVKVVLMSGFAAEEATAGFEGKGLAGFLRKPFRAAELLQAVHEAVGPGEPAAMGA